MLKLSKKWDYAIKTIIFLAKNKEDNFTIKQISEALEISESFLRRVVADLKREKFLESKQGRAGWIQIIKDFSKISLYDILACIWEDLGVADCTSWEFCDKKHNCDTTNIYNNLQKWLNWFLKIYTIDKLL